MGKIEVGVRPKGRYTQPLFPAFATLRLGKRAAPYKKRIIRNLVGLNKQRFLYRTYGTWIYYKLSYAGTNVPA